MDEENRESREPRWLPWFRRLRWYPFSFSNSFDRAVRELREHYREFFDDVEVFSPNISPTEYEILKAPTISEDTGGEYAQETEDAIKEHGFEAVAFYIPYHLAEHWGIYIFLERINGMSYLVARRLGMRFEMAFHSCNRAIVEHESFHFQTEFSSTILETTLMKPIYLLYLERFKPYDRDEEAIANAWMLTSRSRYIEMIRSELERLCSISPPGYRDYGKYMIQKRIMDYSSVRVFWAQRFLNRMTPVFLPIRLEMRASYRLIPTYYLSRIRTPEIADILHFIYNRYRVIDVLKKLKRILPEDIVGIESGGREPFRLVLRCGRRIPIPYPRRKGGYVISNIVREVAENLGIDTKWLRERVIKDP